MYWYRPIVFLFLLCLAAPAHAQTDIFSGTWKIEYTAPHSKIPVKIELKISAAERNLLYPAQLNIKCEHFSGTYKLLLVKKNVRQLAVGRNKIPINEVPFSLGNWPVLLNGILDLSREKGSAFLTTERLLSKPTGLDFPELKQFDPANKDAAAEILYALRDAELKFKKTGDEPWTGDETASILHGSDGYYGIMDSLFAKKKDLSVAFTGNKKSSNGIVSFMLNGKMLIEHADLSYKKPTDEILLDTGINILIMFTEAFGKTAASTGKAVLQFDEKSSMMDFSKKDDVGATFIVQRIYCMPGNSRDSLVAIYQGEGTINSNPTNSYANGSTPNQPGVHTRNDSTFLKTRENSLLRDALLVGSTVVTSAKITLAIWDDAVEDGDSISLRLNGKWITQGLAVKKRPQFITVTVEPGPNKITFIAENLGSIPPNTSVLEIIDGKERKSFMIDTNLRQNNLINIFYDHRPD